MGRSVSGPQTASVDLAVSMADRVGASGKPHHLRHQSFRLGRRTRDAPAQLRIDAVHRGWLTGVSGFHI
jgi:hypothetical protein